MLVLSRKLGEEILVGKNIRLKVIAIQGNQVRLGFAAPKEVSIQREELCQRVEEMKISAIDPKTLETIV
jgi:carbon storage regulator